MVLGKISFQYIMIPKFFINKKTIHFEKILNNYYEIYKSSQYSNNYSLVIYPDKYYDLIFD